MPTSLLHSPEYNIPNLALVHVTHDLYHNELSNSPVSISLGLTLTTATEDVAFLLEALLLPAPWHMPSLPVFPSTFMVAPSPL